MPDVYNTNDLNTDSLVIFRLEDFETANVQHEAGLYKIVLLRGKSVCAPGAALLFFTPDMHYAIDNNDKINTGFLCVFRGSFFTKPLNNKLNDLPVYKHSGRPYPISELQYRQVSGIFMRMLAELTSDYAYKDDLLRNYISQIVHFALKSTTK